MNSNLDQNENQNQNSDHNYRRRDRRVHNNYNNPSGHQMYGNYQSYGNYQQNNGYYQQNYYPNPRWPEWQSNTLYPNDRHFANYPQNNYNFNANQSQNYFQRPEDNGLSEPIAQQRRPDHRRPQKSQNYRPNDGNSRTNQSFVGHQRQKQKKRNNNSQRSADNNERTVGFRPTNADNGHRSADYNEGAVGFRPTNADNGHRSADYNEGAVGFRPTNADNDHRNADNIEMNALLDNTSTAGPSRGNIDRSDNRNEKSINNRKTDFNYENRRKGFQRYNDRYNGKPFDHRLDRKDNTRDNYNQKDDRKVETNKRLVKSKPIPESDESQREIIEEMLRKGEFECMVCCDQIRIKDMVWSCEHCYNVFHLKCIKMWANSESAQRQTDSESKSWRCPTCQALNTRIPSRYYCFCGKVKDPELNRYLVPHSCGEMCGRKRKADPNRKHNCPHKCMLMCHPGSCPPCAHKITRECGCGQTSITVNCATSDEDVVCDKTCNKALNCGQHYCQRGCHFDKCNDCSVIITQKCFCGQNERTVGCDVENNLIERYSCQQKCGKALKCSNHKCEQICHFNECIDCPLDPQLVTHCCCGKTELKQLTQAIRQSCTDPILTCNQICDKELFCGPDKERHRCQSRCHSGQCPPCDQKTVIRCRCGANSDNIECISLSESKDKTFVCKKRCKRKRVCGRHKCVNECCIDSQHNCQEICNKKLTCGQHLCEELCHSGSCPQCWNISWDELSCRCGVEIKLPPIACGTKRPECKLMCSLIHACDHPIDHNCHDDAECPPCTYFTPKKCFGGHESRPIKCCETGYSCGYLCGKPMECGLHECQMICHSGGCNRCTLPCNKVREDCGHMCGLSCHQKTDSDGCPKSLCKITTKVRCDCGRKTELMPCFKVNDENSLRISMNALANQRIKNGESVDVTAILMNLKDFKHIQLKCDEKCAIIERNRQLAEALELNDADFSPDPGPPKYSDLLKNSTRTDLSFVANIYDKLTKLVIESKQSKLNFKNFNFPPMGSENRHIIHELAEHFGCKTHAVDREPNRSVIVKALKDKCYLPTISLMDVVKEETDCPKAGNKSNKITLKSHCFDSESNETNYPTLNPGLSLKRYISTDSTPDNSNQQNTKQIDYFDFKGD